MLFGVGCTPDGGEGAGDEAMPEIAVNPTSFATTLEGGEQVITVTSNGNWVVSCDQTDVVITPASGEGDGNVTITVPAVTTAREFKVTFEASKMTYIPALGSSMVLPAEPVEVTVSQNNGGVNLDDYLFYENCGEDVEKDSNGYWPYVDKFEGWNPQGEASANVAYTGKSASVRAANSQQYGPTAEAVGVSDKPYAFLNKVPSSAYFVIENIAVTGGSNYIFTFNTSCQTVYSPLTFAEVTNSLVHLELGYDGVNWDAVDCTYTPNGGNGWYAAVVEFKVAADATKLYARFTYEQGGGSTSDTGCRLDDFKLVAGGNGAELAPEAPVTPEPTPDPTPADAYFYESFTNGQGAFTTNDVTLGDGLTYVWKHDASYACMKASAYSGSAKASESWLISPEFSLAGATSPVLSFDHAINHSKGTAAEALTLWVKESTATEWTQVTIPSYPASDSWIFYPAGSADLSAYVNKTIQVAFKYTSTTSIAATWEVKNVKVAEGSATTEPEQPGEGEGGETPETPETPVIPEGGTAIEFTTDSVKAAIPDITTNGYGSQNVTNYSTFLTWDVFAACKLCLPPAGDYATANCLQMQGNTDAAKQGRVGNVAATPKRITKVIVESYNAKYTPNFNLALGTEQVVGTSVPANMIPASSMTTSSVVEGALTKYVSTYEVTSGDYTYFAIYKNTTGAFYFSKIRVEYAE